jgi:hypothetical protein
MIAFDKSTTGAGGPEAQAPSASAITATTAHPDACAVIEDSRDREPARFIALNARI